MRRREWKRSTRWLPLALSALAAVAWIGLSGGVAMAQMFHPDYGPNPPSWLSTLHISGHVQNSSGVFIDSNAIDWNYKVHPDGSRTNNRNSLSTERNFVQVDVNDNMTENSQLFLRAWGVYEPAYPFETGCASKTQDCNADYYNEYGIREFWVKQRFGPLQLFVGRQLVVWGESVAFRATDVVNPQDLSWGFGFAQLEQSRLPIWLIHPILNLPDWGPFAANFLEIAYQPGFDFLYNHVDLVGNANDGQNSVAGRINILPPVPEAGRYSGRADDRAIVNVGQYPGFPGTPAMPQLLATAWPLVRYENAGPIPDAAPLGPGLYTPIVVKHIPRATWANSGVFIRLHTLVKDYEVTAVFARGFEFGSSFKLTNTATPVAPGVPVYNQVIQQFYPQYMGAGMTANKPLYLPGPLATLPFVARFEAFYKNHATYNSFAIPGTVLYPTTGSGVNNGITHSDTIYWILGLDLDSAYVPWLTSTGTLTANFEVDGTTLTSYSHNISQAVGTGFTRRYHNDIGGSINLLTSWWWSAIAPNWTMVYNPNGETFLLFPGIQLNPPWTNKYFVSFKWIEILGTNKVGPDAGFFKGLSQFVAVFQYNFNVL